MKTNLPHLPFTGHLVKRNLNIRKEEDSCSDGDKVDAVQDHLINELVICHTFCCLSKSALHETIQSASEGIIGEAKLTAGEISNQILTAASGDVQAGGQEVRLLLTDERVDEFTEDQHEEREGDAVSNSRDGANEHQNQVKNSGVAKLEGGGEG